MSVYIYEYAGARPGGRAAPDLSAIPVPGSGCLYLALAFANDAGGGNFQPRWDPAITPDVIAQLKEGNSAVLVSASLGGEASHGPWVPPPDQAGWVGNATSSLLQLMDTYNLDGLDIDYEGGSGRAPLDQDSFVACMSQVISNIGSARGEAFASIIPFGRTAEAYQALHQQCGTWITFVNYQAYADGLETAQDYLNLYAGLAQRYPFGYSRLGLGIASSLSEPRGLQPPDISAVYQALHAQGLESIAVWCAENSVEWQPPYAIESTIISES